MSLSNKHCTTCQTGTASMTAEQAETLLNDLPDWKLINDSNGLNIECLFNFNDFAKALDFVTHVSKLAEAENHHPEISFGWGYAAIRFTTHAINGLHENDFIMAAKINDHYRDNPYLPSTKPEPETQSLP